MSYGNFTCQRSPTNGSFLDGTETSNPDELDHNVSVCTHGVKVVDEEVIMDEIQSFIEDPHALEACRSRE